MREIQLRRLLRAGRIRRVGLVDHSVVAIAVIGLERRLIAGPGEQRRHHRSISIIGIHGRKSQQHLHGVNQVHRGVELMVNLRMVRASWRIFADHQRDAAMSVNMVRAILRVVFQDKDRRVVPVGTVRHRLNHSTDREVIVGNGSVRRRQTRVRPRSVVIRQPQQNKLRHLLAAAARARFHKAGEFAQKFVSAKLVRIVKLEIGVLRIEMPLQLRLGGRVIGNQRDRVLIRILAAAEACRQLLARLHLAACARATL